MALVLARRWRERVRVTCTNGEVVTIDVAGFRHLDGESPKVVLAISAPPSVVIDREEVALRRAAGASE